VLLEIFEDNVWQMSLGERAAIEGVLAQLRPKLAIEIGSAEGAALRRIAAHSEEVHSFDLLAPSLPQPDNVRLHTGDSHELLPAFLAEIAGQGRNVDFVMVDGDHTPDGVRQDVEDLLDSRALARTVILIHDTANERVRSGVDSVRFAAWPKVVHVELDWISGKLFAEPALRNELWYGLGLVTVDAASSAYRNGSVYEQRYQAWGPLLADVRELILARERASLTGRDLDPFDTLRERSRVLSLELAVARTHERELEAELSNVQGALRLSEERRERADRVLEDVMSSPSWKLTQPLRAGKRRAKAPRRRAGDA